MSAATNFSLSGGLRGGCCPSAHVTAVGSKWCCAESSDVSLLTVVFDGSSGVQSNPFGAARPREQVIAERTGKNEGELLKELAEKEWKPTVSASITLRQGT